MSYIDDFINAVNDIECQKAMDNFNANLPIQKGWITTEDGDHLFIGADGILHGGKAAYEAHQSESGSGPSPSGKDSGKSEEKSKASEMYEGPSKNFKDATDAKEYFGDAWENSLSKSEKTSVVWYTGSGYNGINSELRAGSEISDYYSDAIKSIDSALAKTELKDTVEVYRYSDAQLFGFDKGSQVGVQDLEGLIGAVVTDNGYTSTSVLPKNTSDFGEVGMRITVPPGKGRGAYVANISKFEDEYEFLLARGSNFKITSVSKDANGTPIVEMTIID